MGLQPPDHEVQHFKPPAHASSSARRPSNSALPEAEETANDYDYEDCTPSLPDTAADEPPEDDPQPSERDPKRARSEYDLKWVEELKSHSEIDNNEVFSYLTECQDDLDVLVMAPLRNPVLYMAKKLNNSEVPLQRLSNLEVVLFQRAKMKEVNSFPKNGAVRKCLDDAEIREAYGSGRILKARWVLTWKPI